MEGIEMPNGATSRCSKTTEAGETPRVRKWILGLALAAIATAPLMAQDWPMFGQNLNNTASSAAKKISTSNVGSLKPKWTFTTGGDVTARAAVVNSVAYFPDWAGNIYAVNAINGQRIWAHQLSDYGLAAGTVSRTSPAVVGGVVYIGTQYNGADTNGTGWLLAIDAATGNLDWKVQPDKSNSFPVITASPTVANGMVYVGMTSNEEFVAAAGSTYYHCCSVRGSLVAVNANKGNVVWQTFTVPAGYSGGAVWGSSPVVDINRKTVFIGTGNNYSVPTDPAYVACIGNGGTEASCLSPNDHADSILALDMNTGAIKWATRLMNWDIQNAVLPFLTYTPGSDSWNVDCFVTFTNCPAAPVGPDFDFGSGPNEITYNSGGHAKTIIGAGQKSGIYYALDPDTGAQLWATWVGPGSSLGGMEWGQASDGTRIYVAICNFFGLPYSAGNAGSWAALDPATGRILWQKADPNGAIDIGPMTVGAGGVVYAGSMGGPSSTTAQTMFALDAASGNQLWSFASGSSVNAGATLVDGMVYWGSGYSHFGFGSGSTTFYAFSPNGN